jgi:predicted PurR-regulated permease PerM
MLTFPAARSPTVHAGTLSAVASESMPREPMPRWVPRAIALFWGGLLLALALRAVFERIASFLVLVLVSVFLAFALEPAVNALQRRRWRRGAATIVLLLAVFSGLALLVTAIGTLVATQARDLVDNRTAYVEETVSFLNDSFGTTIDAERWNDAIDDPDGTVQSFFDRQQGRVLRLSMSALGGTLQIVTILLFTFYLAADGPRLRRTICSRLPPDRQRVVLQIWGLAIDKTGGYIYSRLLLAAVSSVVHWLAFQVIGTSYPVVLGLWVGVVSQFLPVVGTYLSGALPVLLAFLDSPVKALAVIVVIVVYQQFENFLLAPRLTARTLEIHPAVAFGSAIAGGALLGPVGALLALPVAAMAHGIVGEWGHRHELVIDPLFDTLPPQHRRRPE